MNRPDTDLRVDRYVSDPSGVTILITNGNGQNNIRFERTDDGTLKLNSYGSGNPNGLVEPKEAAFWAALQFARYEFEEDIVVSSVKGSSMRYCSPAAMRDRLIHSTTGSKHHIVKAGDGMALCGVRPSSHASGAVIDAGTDFALHSVCRRCLGSYDR